MSLPNDQPEAGGPSAPVPAAPSAPAAPVQAPAYNNLFQTFVPDPSADSLIEDLAAYGTYKLAKREWVIDFVAANGRSPNPAEYAAYHQTWTGVQIASTRNAARVALAKYADVIIKAEEPRILKDALKGSVWKGIGVGLATAFIYSLLLIGIALILKVIGIDVVGVFQRIGTV